MNIAKWTTPIEVINMDGEKETIDIATQEGKQRYQAIMLYHIIDNADKVKPPIAINKAKYDAYTNILLELNKANEYYTLEYDSILEPLERHSITIIFNDDVEISGKVKQNIANAIGKSDYLTLSYVAYCEDKYQGKHVWCISTEIYYTETE